MYFYSSISVLYKMVFFSFCFRTSVPQFCQAVGLHRRTRAPRRSTVRRRSQRTWRTLHAAVCSRRGKWNLSIPLISLTHLYRHPYRPTSGNHSFISLVTVYITWAIKNVSTGKAFPVAGLRWFSLKNKKKQEKNIFTCGTFLWNDLVYEYDI